MNSLRCVSLMALLCASTLAQAELQIFDVRKNLALADNEKTFRDFYINGGTEAGLSNGMIITVQRRLPLYDTYLNRSAGDLELKVAKIKIIHVQKGLSVARLHSEFSRDTAPLLEDNFIMVGDRLDLATAVSGASEGKSAGVSQPAPEAVADGARTAQILVNAVQIQATDQSSLAKPTPESPEKVEVQLQ